MDGATCLLLPGVSSWAVVGGDVIINTEAAKHITGLIENSAGKTSAFIVAAGPEAASQWGRDGVLMELDATSLCAARHEHIASNQETKNPATMVLVLDGIRPLLHGASASEMGVRKSAASHAVLFWHHNNIKTIFTAVRVGHIPADVKCRIGLWLFHSSCDPVVLHREFCFGDRVTLEEWVNAFPQGPGHSRTFLVCDLHMRTCFTWSVYS